MVIPTIQGLASIQRVRMHPVLSPVPGLQLAVRMPTITELAISWQLGDSRGSSDLVLQ